MAKPRGGPHRVLARSAGAVLRRAEIALSSLFLGLVGMIVNLLVRLTYKGALRQSQDTQLPRGVLGRFDPLGRVPGRPLLLVDSLHQRSSSEVLLREVRGPALECTLK